MVCTRQVIEVCTNKRSITIKKPFRLVRMEVEPVELSTVGLVVTYDGLKDSNYSTWYIENYIDPLAKVQIDWVLIDNK